MVGLRTLFEQAGTMQDIVLPIPPAASALWRILYVIAARVTALDDPEMSPRAWAAQRRAAFAHGAFDVVKVNAYFDDPITGEGFNLFHSERPFLQDPRLREQCKEPSGINKLVYGRPAGRNQVLLGLFTDTAPVPIPADQAAWNLLVHYFYGPHGTCTPRTVGEITSRNGTDGPLRKTVSYHPVGRTLFESLIAGLAPPPTEEPSFDVDDIAPWEGALRDPLAPLPPVTWPAGLLTGRSRHAILLQPDDNGHSVIDAYITWSTRQPVVTAVDPYTILDVDSRSVARPRRAEAARALWRDLDALLLKDARPGEAIRPAVFRELADLPREALNAMRVRAYGFEQDTSGGVNTSDDAWFAAVSPPVLDRLAELDREKALRIARCRLAAEAIHDKLAFASRLAWAESISPPLTEGKRVKLDTRNPGPWKNRATRAYWSTAERTFWRLILQDEDVEPHRAFADDALDALTLAVSGAERRQKSARAIHHARAIIRTAIPKPVIDALVGVTPTASEDPR